MRRLLAPAACALLLAASPSVAANAPPQPKAGPGGTDYVGADVAKRAIGRASAASFAFHLGGPASEPRPVVIFLHAWGATNPQAYGGWIEHLARKGNLVLWPRFQELGKTRPSDATANAVALLKDAFAALAADPEARPDLNRVAVIGHLAGAPLAFNVAAAADGDALPRPKLVLALMAGGIASDEKSRGILLKDVARIDPGTLLVTLIGDREHLPSDRASKRLLREASAVPITRKVFMRVLSDSHGFPALSATLASPGAVNDAFDAAKIKIPPDPPLDPKQPRPRGGQRWSADMVLTGEQTVLVAQLNASVTDATDYMGFWKSADHALAAAFAGRDGQALRDLPALTDMGRWSDGWPVKRLSAEVPRLEEAPQQQASENVRQPRPRR